MRVFGIAGFKNSGKTTLIVDLIRHFVGRGLRVATLKHAHHAFDIDHPGKDSHLHRAAGASQVIVASRRRWAQIVELGDTPEPGLSALLARIEGVDLVLIEGYKHGPHPRLELRRADAPARELVAEDPGICAIVADFPVASAPVPVIHRSEVAAIAELILANAAPLDALQSSSPDGQASG